MNASLRLIVRKGRGKSGLNKSKRPAYVTKEKSEGSPEDPFMAY